MPTTDDGRWTISVGPHGAKVRAREHPKRGGNVYLFAWDPELGGNRKVSLGFKVRDADGKLMTEPLPDEDRSPVQKAKDAAAELSNRLIRGEAPTADEEEEPDATVGRVFDLFRAEGIDSDLSDSHEAELRRGLESWETFLGRSFDLRTVGVREWDAFRRQRASGEIDSRGNKIQDPDSRREVAPRTVAKDLKTLRQVCRFAARYRDGDTFILDADPTRGLELPSEPNPKRPVCSEERYHRLLEGAEKVRIGHVEGEDQPDEKIRPPLQEILVLCWETGRRIGAIVRLRWSDWFPEEASYGVLRWRADSDKLGREWRAPVTPEVREVLQTLRQQRPGVGEAYIFPAPEAEGEHVRVDTARGWLLDAEDHAGLDHPDGFGFHALRRAWATKRKHMSSQDVAYAGGWKDTATLERVYQQPDPETTERVVLGGRELGMGSDGEDDAEARTAPSGS